MFLVLRAIAATLVVVMGGLPVAGLLCASECVTATHAAAQSETGEAPCHEDNASEAPGWRSHASGGCNLLALTEVAARDRTVAPLVAVPHAASPVERAITWPSQPGRSVPTSPPFYTGAGARAPRPLRI